MGRQWRVRQRAAPRQQQQRRQWQQRRQAQQRRQWQQRRRAQQRGSSGSPPHSAKESPRLGVVVQRVCGVGVAGAGWWDNREGRRSGAARIAHARPRPCCDQRCCVRHPLHCPPLALQLPRLTLSLVSAHTRHLIAACVTLGWDTAAHTDPRAHRRPPLVCLAPPFLIITCRRARPSRTRCSSCRGVMGGAQVRRGSDAGPGAHPSPAGTHMLRLAAPPPS